MDLKLSDITFELMGGGTSLFPHVYSVPISYSTDPDPHKYAVLFSGGVDIMNAHVRYWNDLKFMYSALVGPLGFPEENVIVLYADGSWPRPVHAGGRRRHEGGTHLGVRLAPR